MKIYFGKEAFRARYYDTDLSGEVMLALPGIRRMLCEEVPAARLETFRSLLQTNHPITIEEPFHKLMEWLNDAEASYIVEY